MVEYRPLPEERLEEFAALWSYAYQQLADHVDPAEVDGLIEPARVGEQRGVFDGSELVAICRHHFLRATVRRKTLPIGCLASVATPPEHRRKGYVRALIHAFLEEYRDRGIPLSALWAFDYPFYDRFGWALSNQYAVRECSPERLEPTTPPATGAFVRLDPDEFERLATVLAAHGSPYELAVERTEEWWRERTFRDRGGDPHVYGWEADGELRGYLVYTLEREDDVVLDVGEVAYVDQTAYRELLRFLARHQSQADRVRLSGPVEDPLVDLIEDPAAVETTVHPGPSIRLVDVAAALSAIEYPAAVTDSLALAVEDPVADWNDRTFRLEIDDGTATAEATTDAPAATLGVDALSQLVVGYRTADALVGAGELAVEDRGTRTLLETAFPLRDVFLREDF
jgi:predicted acetyltransferase